jgi:release factor glutamine methyltransferase
MTANNSIKKVISFIKSELKDFYPANEIDSFVFLIFEQLFEYSKIKLLTSQDVEIQEDSLIQIKRIINELKLFKPIQYILKETTFYNLKIKLKSNVLIPRPETEELVEWVIQENKNRPIKILDIGTGSGCIAIALAKSLPQSKVYAYDISTEALKQAESNSKLNKVAIVTKQLDILNPKLIKEKFDIIVSNPPYITEKEKQLMHKNVLDYEPNLALFVPNENPLIFYKAIIKFGLLNLKSNGKIYLEINESFGKETAQLFEEEKFYDIQLKKDINGKDRMLKGILK